MKVKLFNLWLRKQLMQYAQARRLLLLLLDRYSFPDTIKLAAENSIIIFTLPPNTTHFTQPLDKGVFGPFKTHWKWVCHDFQVSHSGRVVNQYNFCSLFGKAWIECMTCANIMASFGTTGVYPMNWDAILSALPSEPRLSERIIVPWSTPFKRIQEDDLYMSADIPTQPSVNLAKRPNSFTGVVS